MDWIVRILVVWTLCVPAQAELTEGDPFANSPPKKVDAGGPPLPPVPDFPPGVPDDGPGPGFDQDELDNPLGNPSTIGAGATDLTYLIAGLVTLASAYYGRRALRTSSQAMGDLWHRSQRRQEFEPLREAFEKMNEQHPKVMENLAILHGQYLKDWEALNEHLAGNTRSVREIESSIPKHLKSLLELPLLKRRNRVRQDLEERISAWENQNDPGPLHEWIRENQTKDILRTQKGKQWQETLETLQWELAQAHWSENKSLEVLDQWLEVLPKDRRERLASDSWVSTYQGLKDREQRSARSLVKETQQFNQKISAALGPEILGPLLTLGESTRTPGTFQNHRDRAMSWLGPQSVLPAAQQNCQTWLGHLNSHTAVAATRHTVGGIGRRLLFPALPVAGGLGVGGHYSVEGLRYYLQPSTPGEMPAVPDLIPKPN